MPLTMASCSKRASTVDGTRRRAESGDEWQWAPTAHVDGLRGRRRPTRDDDVTRRTTTVDDNWQLWRAEITKAHGAHAGAPTAADTRACAEGGADADAIDVEEAAADADAETPAAKYDAHLIG